MKPAIAIALVLLSGCASRTLTPDVAQRMSAVALCRGVVTFGPISAGVAQAEVQSRGIDCAPLMPMIQAQDTARQAAALQMLQQSTIAPQPITPYMPPQQINCQTYRFGTIQQTNCR